MKSKGGNDLDKEIEIIKEEHLLSFCRSALSWSPEFFKARLEMEIERISKKLAKSKHASDATAKEYVVVESQHINKYAR